MKKKNPGAVALGKLRAKQFTSASQRAAIKAYWKSPAGKARKKKGKA